MPLRYGPFAASAGICKAARNSPALSLGTKGSAVAILQGGLLDAGERLPITTAKANRPDGVFGRETRDAVISFQGRKSVALKQDGVAGKKTIEALDHLLATKSKLPPVVPPPPRPIPISAHYILGTVDPPRGHDPGAEPAVRRPPRNRARADR